MTDGTEAPPVEVGELAESVQVSSWGPEFTRVPLAPPGAEVYRCVFPSGAEIWMSRGASEYLFQLVWFNPDGSLVSTTAVGSPAEATAWVRDRLNQRIPSARAGAL